MAKIKGFERTWAGNKERDVGAEAEQNYLLSVGVILAIATIFLLSIGCAADLPKCDATVDDGSHVSLLRGFNPSLDITVETDLVSEDAVWNSAEDWNERTGTDIIVGGDPRAGALSVPIVDGDCDMEFVAEAQWPGEGECWIVLNPCRFHDEVSKETTIAHEIGHCLTFRHNSNPKSLMCGGPFDCEWDQCIPTITDSMAASVQKAILN